MARWSSCAHHCSSPILRTPPSHHPNPSLSISAQQGIRDVFHIKSMYFDQKFSSVFFLAPDAMAGEGGLTDPGRVARSLPSSPIKPAIDPEVSQHRYTYCDDIWKFSMSLYERDVMVI